MYVILDAWLWQNAQDQQPKKRESEVKLMNLFKNRNSLEKKNRIQHVVTLALSVHC